MTTAARQPVTVPTSPASWGLVALVSLCWIAIRLVSDFPRGLAASGVKVSDLSLNLSYFLLPTWLVGALATCRFRVPSSGPIRSFFMVFLLLLAYETLEFVQIVVTHGGEGLTAGSYVLLVGLSFFMVSSLGYGIGTRVEGQRDVHMLGLLLLFATAPNAIMAIVQLTFGLGREVEGVSRVYGFTSSPNILAAVAAVNALGLHSLNSYIGLKSKLLTFSVFAWIGIAVITFSLAGIGSLFAALFALLYLGRARRRIGPLAATLGLLMPILFGWLLWSLTSDILVQRISEFGNDENSLVWRLRVWTEYLAALMNPRVLAVGAGLGYDHLSMPDDAHNEYLRVAVEMGLVGLALFLAPLAQAVRAARRVHRDMAMDARDVSLNARALPAGVAALALFSLVNGTVEAVLHSSPSMLLEWFYIGLFLGLLLGQNNRQSECEP